ITRATGKGDVSALIAKLGAREIAAGAIIYRKDGKLYIADNVAVPPAAGATTDPPAGAAAGPGGERRRAPGIRDPDTRLGQPARVSRPGRRLPDRSAAARPGTRAPAAAGPA